MKSRDRNRLFTNVTIRFIFIVTLVIVVEGLKDNATNLMNNTNNRVESINQKLKGVISKFSNIVAFFDDLMKTVKSFRTERDHRAIRMFQKVQINRFENNPSLSQYSAQVTPFAFGYIVKQMDASHKITYDGSINSNTVAVLLQSCDGDLTVTATSCECGFYKSMNLPCRHILYFRRQSSLDEYSPELSAYRWTKSYYRKSHVAFDESQQSESSIQVTTTPRRRGVRVLSGQDKFRRVHGITQQLARLVSDMPMRQFNDHVQKLELIVDLLKDGQEYSVQGIRPEDIHEDTTTTTLDPILEIVQDNEDADDVRGSLQMADYASNTSSVFPDNAEPRPTAVELATSIQNKFMSSSTTLSNSSAYLEGNVSGDNELVTTDESQSESIDDAAVTSSDDFPSLKLPPKMKRRGRPKGAETTVVGLPRRTKRILPFLKRRPKEKEEAMLSWILKPGVNITVMEGNVMLKPNDIVEYHIFPTKILDENKNISRIKKYFSPEAWTSFNDGLTLKKPTAEWNCMVCETDVHTSPSVVCDGCLEWYHLKCANLKQAPKSTYWICRRCHAK